MDVVNVLANMAKTPIDPEVGIAIVPGASGPKFEADKDRFFPDAD